MIKDTEGLKDGEEKILPSGDDQPEKKTPEPKTPEGEPEGDEDKVEISKADLAKVKEDRDNYKKAFLSAKKKAKRTLTEEKKDDDEEFDYLPKKEFYKANEDSAVERAIKDLPELDQNWEVIVPYYAPRRGRNDVDGIIADIKDAYYLWQRDNKKPEKEEDKDKKAKSDLSKLTNEPTKGKEKEVKPPKRHIIPPKTKPMKDWY